MYRPMSHWLTIGVALCSAIAVQAFEQDRFAIGLWVDPPIDDKAEMRYQRLADAHFTMVIGGFGANTREKVRKQIALCEKHDLKAIVSRVDWEPDELPESDAVWGYMLFDEPHSDQFPELAALTERIREARPGKIGYVNLFPSTVGTERIGNATYRDHLEQFIRAVKPDVLSFDHYPTMKPDGDSRGKYRDSLEIFRVASLKHGLPFWNFFNTMPYGHHADPTEAQLRWQVFTSAAYGAKGVMYFCYYTPGGETFPKGGAIIARDDVPSRHYDEAKRINFALKNLGPALMKLTSTNVIDIDPEESPAEQLKGAPLRDLTRDAHDPKHDFIVGVFKHTDGRRAVLLVNDRYAYAAWPTVVFDAALHDVREVSQVTGEEIAVRDDSPDMAGLQLSFDAGAGRLFLLP